MDHSSSSGHHRASILSRSRASKKTTSANETSLKRSKSLHCPKTRFNDQGPFYNVPAHYSNGPEVTNSNGSGSGGHYNHHPPPLRNTPASFEHFTTNGQHHPQVNGHHLQHYGSRRHHSTNDYESNTNSNYAPNSFFPISHSQSGSGGNSAFVHLNTSSHNLYRLYNSPSSSSSSTVIQPSPLKRTSCANSSGSTSLASLNSLNGRKASTEAFNHLEDNVFLSQQMSNLVLGSGPKNVDELNSIYNNNTPSNGSNHIIKNQRQVRYNGSSSSSSLINGQPDYASLVLLGDEDEEIVEGDEVEASADLDYSLWDCDTNFNWESSLSTAMSTSPGSQPQTGSSRTKKSSNSRRLALFRFYLVRQRNYPPLYLEASGARSGSGATNRRRIYRTLVLGYPSSGKSSLIEQFSTWLAEHESARFHPAVASELAEPTNLLAHFLETDSFDKYLLQVPVVDYQPDVYLILYSVNNRDSFTSVKKTLVDLQRWDDVETKVVIIVANKSDLVRGRCVTKREGRELASANGCKYIEVSCTISHNIDVLMQGLGSQICLKEEQQRKQKEFEQSKVNGAGGAAGHKLKRRDSLLKRFLRKTAINKSKSCDNLHVL